MQELLGSKKIATTQIRALHQTYMTCFFPQTRDEPKPQLPGRRPTKAANQIPLKKSCPAKLLVEVGFPVELEPNSSMGNVYFGNCHVGENWETLVTFGNLLGEKLSEAT